MQILDRLEHVAAKSFAIGQRRAFLEDASFNASAKMFGEVAVELWIDLTDNATTIETNASGIGAGLSTFQQSG